MNLNVFDTHAHLDMSHFDSDREEMINRALDAGVSRINTIGIDIETSRQAIKLAGKHPSILASIGVHPQEAHKVKREDIDTLAELAKHSRVVAIGEMGLDFYHNDAPREAQLQVLEWELEMAKKVGLPIIIHCRQANETMLPIIRSWVESYKMVDGKSPGVIHCFNGDLETAEQYLSLGFYISVGAYIGYPSSSALRETLKHIPQDKLVLETDCPFLPPQRFRGKRNEPAYVVITLGVLAEVKNIPLEEMALRTTDNGIKLFNLAERGLI